MHVTMVKKRFADGSVCKKCVQAEELLKRRNLWEKIDEVVWALEADPTSPGMQLAAQHGVDLAPFFLVTDGGETRVHTSALELIKTRLGSGDAHTPSDDRSVDQARVDADNLRFMQASPAEVVEDVLARFGSSAVIAFSGAEDVVLIDLAIKTGKKFSVLTLDTGRLHPETYRFIDKVRTHYGIEIRLLFPDLVSVERLVQKKGLYSFYQDGHSECCSIRKVEPLRRALGDYRAWLTGQRRDQSPTRADVLKFDLDQTHGTNTPLLKINPLAGWSLTEVWSYIRENEVPYNELHDRGFISIGCEPCTRAIRPGEHERAGRWWWEEATKRECGLHRDH